MMETIAEILVAFLILLGGAFALIGSWGLFRLPSLMTRLHGPTKATTLGVGGILLASVVYFPVFGGRFSAHELLITIFLFIAAPITANMVAKAHLHRQTHDIDPNPADDIQEGLPEKDRWATFWKGDA
ncbi:multicomponent K+:H+ antiporter subunit G [Altererythrobacter atlanticus]|uniref:Na(+)/H(+) antiporter subunit G n=1 Tax=Croceibacterium atlanticum TaxID=1267766 RepID=A0A0F7KR76_9SPHN|nr:Na+/H+ antiporter subunit G [Croceibacterium atlanticum]AKH42104.1 Na(+)/H(+) antiporter subunit G [Croceibacterium atlanticum]MBB5733326.1 multicomponent K+:H+ antiporter subunit G [Croceibacterium atlanticum]